MKQERMRAFLLGRLDEASQQEMAEQAFLDDGFEEELREAEYDLLADWARGELPAEERALVEQRFGRARLETARRLVRPVAARRRWGAVVLALAAGLALGLAPSIYWRQGAGTPVRVVESKVMELALMVPVTRGSNGMAVKIAPGATVVLVSVGAPEGYARYEVRIEAVGRGLVYGATVSAGGGVAQVAVPAGVLKEGAYDVLVSGEGTLLAQYAFRVEF